MNAEMIFDSLILVGSIVVLVMAILDSQRKGGVRPPVSVVLMWLVLLLTQLVRFIDLLPETPLGSTASMVRIVTLASLSATFGLSVHSRRRRTEQRNA